MANKIYVLELYSSSMDRIDDRRDCIYHIYTDSDITSKDLDEIKNRIEKYKSENEGDWSYNELHDESIEYLEEKGYNILEFGYNSIAISM